MNKKNKLEEWDLLKEKEFYLKQILDSIQDIQKLNPAKYKEDLSILHGYCNIMSAFIMEIYNLNYKIERLKNGK